MSFRISEFSSQEGYQFDWVDLAETMEVALLLIAHPLRRDDIRVVKDIAELPLVYASANSLKLVWMNLLLNARDAIRARGGEGEIHIEARVQMAMCWFASPMMDRVFRPSTSSVYSAPSLPPGRWARGWVWGYTRATPSSVNTGVG